MPIDENGVLTFDEATGGGLDFHGIETQGPDYGLITTRDSIANLYTKDPTQVAPSEYDFLGGLANILKAGAPIAQAHLSKNGQAATTPLQQILWPKAAGNAADPAPMKSMSPLLKAGLIVGGIVVVTVIAFVAAGALKK